MKTRLSPLRLFPLVLAALCLAVSAADPAPESGVAKGSFATKGEKPVALTNAAAFTDIKDDDKPVILIISDKKIPVEKWTSEFDLIEAKGKLAFTGIVVFIGKDGAVFRTDMYWKGTQSSVSGVFDVKLDSAVGAKEITGGAMNSDSDPDDPKLDVMFHATLK
ncbi:MAG TPA: hypothetical protein VG733_06120 [Chthoniobacteraceae bacterium]|nr:hypothetical protein [Chthoniobacteraceae bacterium]